LEAAEVAMDRARWVRTGGSATVVAWGPAVAAATLAADRLVTDDLGVDVIDLRSLAPLDWNTIERSVAKTGRLAIVEPGGPSAVGTEVAAHAAEAGFWSLDAAVVRLVAEADPDEAATDIAASVRTLLAV
jgi:pyruvate/2-oxoglutarate/acetoin dehydrogenase E1 component